FRIPTTFRRFMGRFAKCTDCTARPTALKDESIPALMACRTRCGNRCTNGLKTNSAPLVINDNNTPGGSSMKRIPTAIVTVTLGLWATAPPIEAHDASDMVSAAQNFVAV